MNQKELAKTFTMFQKYKKYSSAQRVNHHVVSQTMAD